MPEKLMSIVSDKITMGVFFRQLDHLLENHNLGAWLYPLPDRKYSDHAWNLDGDTPGAVPIITLV